MMQELLLALAQGLVEDKAAVRVTEDEPNEEGVIVYHLTVAEDDMGRVIGKQGRIAKAIRVVMRAAAVRENKRSWWRSTTDFPHAAANENGCRKFPGFGVFATVIFIKNDRKACSRNAVI